MFLRNIGIWILLISGVAQATPTAFNQTVTGCVGTLISGQLSQTGGSGALYFAEVFQSNSNGIAVVNPSGAFTFAPSTPYNLTGAFQYTVSDTTLTTSPPATVSIVIDAPHAASASFATLENIPLVASLSGSVTGGNPPYTYTVVCNVTHGLLVLSSDGSVLSYTPNTGYVGQDSFLYQATDASGCTTSPAIVYINVGTTCALSAQSANATICQNSSLTGTLQAFGASGTARFYLVTGSVTGGVATVLPSGQFTFTGTSGVTGPAGFNFGVTDSAQCSSTGTESITLNQAPVATNLTFNEPFSYPVNATVANNVTGGVPPYTFTEVGNPVNGTVLFNPDGSFVFTPSSTTGVGSFQYQATDSSGTHCTSNVATVTINFGLCTLSPISGTASVCPNSSVTGQLFATGASGPDFFFLITGSNQLGNATVNPSGLFTFTAGNTAGPGGFQFGVSDSICSKTGAETVYVDSPPMASNVTLSTQENTPLNGNLNAYVTGGTPPYTFTQVGSAINGVVVINPNGTFTFTPAANFVGTAEFFYTVTDANHCSNGATRTVTIRVTACSLSAISATASICENSSVTGQLGANGASGTALFYLVTGSATGGVATVSPSGQFTFTGTTGLTGPGGFVFGVTDSSSCSATGRESITINAAPVAANQSASTPENTTLNGTLPAPTGGTPPYTYAKVGTDVNGTATVNPNGTYSFVPFPGFIGTASFTYHVTDSAGCVSNTATVTITVTGSNCTLVADPGTVTGCQGSTITGTLSATGASGAATFYYITGSAQNGTVTVSPNGQFIFTGITGPAGFNFGVIDSAGCTGSAHETVALNLSPIAQNGSATTTENVPVNGTLSTLVSGGTPPYTYTQVGTAVNGTVSINSANGNYTFTPATNVTGMGSFQYRVTDAAGCVSAVATVTITINPPACTLVANPGTVTGCQNNPITGILSATGAQGAETFYLVTGSAQNGTVTVAPNGQFTFTGTAAPAGFNFGVVDSLGCSSTAHETVAVNLNPVAQNGTASTTENVPVNGTLSTLVSSGTPPYTYTQVGTAVNGTVLINSANGNYTFTPATNVTGMGSFQYRVTDAAGCVSAVATVTITINPPACTLVANPGTVTGCQNNPITGTLSATGAQGAETFYLVTGSAQNGTVTVAPNGQFTFTGTAAPAGFNFGVVDSLGCSSTAHETVAVNLNPVAQNGTATTTENVPVNGTLTTLVSSGTPPYTYTQVGPAVNGSVVIDPTTGEYTFTPAPNFIGTGSFSYHVTDSVGCVSNTAVVTVTINATPCTLHAVSGTSAICENSILSGTLTATGVSGTANFYLVTGSSQKGTATVLPSGQFTYTGTTGATGPGGFEFGVTDSAGCVSVGTESITLNSVPVAQNETIPDQENEPISGTLVNLVSGGTPPLIFSQVGTGQHGTAVVNSNGTFTFTPDEGYVGAASFQYRVVDSSSTMCASNVATVTIEIACDLVANPLATSTRVDGTVMGQLTASAGTPPYVFSLVTGSEVGGTAIVNPDGSFTFTAATGFSGTAHFEFQVTDAAGCSAQAEVTIAVSNPVVGNVTVTTNKNVPYIGTLAGDVTGGTPPYTFVQVGTAVNGTVVLNANGTFTFTPDPNFVGTASFMFEVIDANGGVSNVGTVTIDVIQCPPVTNPFYALYLETIFGIVE